MSIHFNRKIFFDGFKAKFDSSLDQDQVDGIAFLLDQFEREPLWKSLPQLAYAWATIFHETAGSMLPVEEGFYLVRYGKARVKSFQKSLRYFPFFGRGYVQLTWETRRIPNYSKATRELRRQRPNLVAEFESKTGQNFDLVKHPEQALDPLIAFAVMTLGMFQGWFTGKEIGEFIAGKKKNYFECRTVINGHDKAGAIATLAERFERLLTAALVSTEQGSADSNIGLPQQPAINAVELPDPGADGSPAASGEGEVVETVSETFETDEGTKTVEASVTTPAGDAPDVPPSTFLNLEDWKPFAARWLKRLWTGVSTVTLPGGFGLGFMAIKDPPNWFIYVAIGVVVLIVIVVLALIVSAVLLAIWYFNRKEIRAGKEMAAASLVDPNSKNLGVTIEPK